MALSTVIKDQESEGTFTLRDGTLPTALELVVRFDMANMQVSGLKPGLRDTNVYQSRGKVHSKRPGPRVFPTLSFGAMLAEFSEVTTGTIMDFLLGTTGTPFETRESTSGEGQIFTCDVIFDIEGTDLGDDKDHQLVFEDVELVCDIAQGNSDAFTLNGTVYGGISGDLSIIVDV